MIAEEQKGRIPFNGRVLKWARERRSFAVEDAAKRINVTPDKLNEWEAGGGSTPTVRQARALAAYYDRPFLEFLSKQIPNVPETKLVPDFRSYRGETPDKESDALKELHRWAEEVRLNALDLLETVGDTSPRVPKDAYATADDDVEKAAERARALMGPSLEKQIGLNQTNRAQFPQTLRWTFERTGIIVLRINGLSALRTRGICLFADPLPVIIYGGEAPGAQAFTLAHELGHILLRQSAISGPPRQGGVHGAKKIESWCNRFAAAFLMPRANIEADAKDLRGAATVPDDRLSALANRYAVSRHAMLIRLVNLGIARPEFYWFVKRRQFEAEEAAFEGRGRSKYYGSRYRASHGDFYTGLVIEAWNSGSITNHNAAEYLGIKNLVHLNDIRSNFGT